VTHAGVIRMLYCTHASRSNWDLGEGYVSGMDWRRAQWSKPVYGRCVPSQEESSLSPHSSHTAVNAPTSPDRVSKFHRKDSPNTGTKHSKTMPSSHLSAKHSNSRLISPIIDIVSLLNPSSYSYIIYTVTHKTSESEKRVHRKPPVSSKVPIKI